MILGKYEKQPGEAKLYEIDYRPWLAQIAGTLTSVSVTSIDCLDTPVDTALTCETAVIFAFDGVASSGVRVGKVAGGTDGKRYKLTLRAVSSDGQIDESELIFKIKDY